MQARGKRGPVVRLSCAAASLAIVAAPAFAQASDPTELDPTAPMAPLPDLGVDWPDMNAPDAPPPTDAGTEALPKPVAIDAAEERRYTVVIEGLQGVDEEPAIAKAFDAQSALREGRGQAANAAQIDRRSRADADLLAELLRSRGYYDATVDPRIETAQQALRVDSRSRGGASVHLPDRSELPGLKLGRPGSRGSAQGVRRPRRRRGHCRGRHKGRDGPSGRARRTRLCASRKSGSRKSRSITRPDRQPGASGAAGPVAHYGTISVSGSPPFSPRHIQTIARFAPGDPFKRSEVNDLRRALIATGLVAVADVKVVPSADRQTVDIDVHLEPAPMRTLAGELGYGTGEGVRAEASWQHRNFFNPEGALTLRGVAGTHEQLVVRRVCGEAISCAATRCSTCWHWRATSIATPIPRKDGAAERVDRAPEQHHLAQEMDVELRRRSHRHRRTRHLRRSQQ